jgi:hypothetical protein
MIWLLVPLGVGIWTEIFNAKPLGLAVDAGVAGVGDLVGLDFRPSLLPPAWRQPG